MSAYRTRIPFNLEAHPCERLLLPRTDRAAIIGGGVLRNICLAEFHVNGGFNRFVGTGLCMVRILVAIGHSGHAFCASEVITYGKSPCKKIIISIIIRIISLMVNTW